MGRVKARDPLFAPCPEVVIYMSLLAFCLVFINIVALLRGSGVLVVAKGGSSSFRALTCVAVIYPGTVVLVFLLLNLYGAAGRAAASLLHALR